MKDYYQILGIDQLTSKPLVRIAYSVAIEYALAHKLGEESTKDINTAYAILKSYRLRIRYQNAKSTRKTDAKIQSIIEGIDSNSNSGNLKLTRTASKRILEIKYILKSLVFEIYVFILYLISSTLGDILGIMSSGVSFFSSVIFYFGILNLWANWLNPAYSILAILLSIGILVWFLSSFQRNVIRSITNKHKSQNQ
ncbi:MAG: hypothetical protein NXI20_25950 [bacterium]|nr:hypothetical protein [bacterium]